MRALIKHLLSYIPDRYLPLVVILTALLLAVVFVFAGPKPPKAKAPENETFVTVIEAKAIDPLVKVYQHGPVSAAQAINLQAEVTGKVIEMSPKLMPGSRFTTGELLLQIDPRDYEFLVAQRKADLEKALLALKEEEGRKEVASQEWKLLAQDLKISQSGKALALRTPYLKQAQAAVEAAKAALNEAELKLSRTAIRAPFNGFIESEEVDLGKLVSPQTFLARLIGTDTFWVEVALAPDELRWLTISSEDSNGSLAKITPRAAHNSGKVYQGRVIRLVGSLTPNTRTAKIIIEINDPWGLKSTKKKDDIPLLIGSWVDVEIIGRQVKNVYRLPISALHEDNELWLMNKKNELEFRKVRVLKQEADKTVLIAEGLQDGDLVISSRIATPLPGMKLRLSKKAQEGSDAKS